MFLLPLSDLPRTALTVQVADMACRTSQTPLRHLCLSPAECGAGDKDRRKGAGETHPHMCE